MRLYDILEGIEHDTKVKLKSIKVDGGVSQSDIQLQCLADFADVQVERAPEPDMTSTGAAYFAGLSVGFWRDLAELKGLQQNQNYELFVPKMKRIPLGYFRVNNQVDRLEIYVAYLKSEVHKSFLS